MYRPKCAIAASDQQRFCRSCGLSLELVRWTLSYEPDEDVSEGRLRVLKRALKRMHKRRRKVRQLEIALIGVFAIALIAFNRSLLVHHQLDWTTLGIGSLALGVYVAIEVTLSLRRVLPELEAAMEDANLEGSKALTR